MTKGTYENLIPHLQKLLSTRAPNYFTYTIETKTPLLARKRIATVKI
jgi:hypothetical protein